MTLDLHSHLPKLTLGQRVTLPIGLRVGAGRLRTAVVGIVDNVQRTADGSGTIYGVTFVTRGKTRHTWIDGSELL